MLHSFTHSTIFDNIGRKCNRAALYVFTKVLALLSCGRQFLQIIASFFLSSRILGFLFAIPNFTAGFMRLWNEETNYETNVMNEMRNERYRSHHVAEGCSFEMVYDITLI